MKLTLEQLNAALNGVTDAVEENGAVRLRTFTEEQRLYQYKPDGTERWDKLFWFESFVTPTAKLDFTTDSETLTVTLVDCATREETYFGVDLWQRGVLTHHESFDLPEDGVKEEVSLPDRTFRHSLLPGTKRVEFFFPRNIRYKIKEVSLSDGASFEPTRYERSFLAFGDSITAAEASRHPSFGYVTRVARNLSARVINYGVGGEHYEDKRIVPGTYPKTDFVLAAYGTNGRKRKNYRELTEGFFEALYREFHDRPVFVILPTHRMGEEAGEEFVPLPRARQIIREICGRYDNITVLDGEKFVPWDIAAYFDGFLHPNDLGMTHYAMNLTAALTEELAKRKGANV